MINKQIRSNIHGDINKHIWYPLKDGIEKPYSPGRIVNLAEHQVWNQVWWALRDHVRFFELIRDASRINL